MSVRPYPSPADDVPSHQHTSSEGSRGTTAATRAASRTVARLRPLRPLGKALLLAAKATTLAVAADAVRHPKQPKWHGKAMRIRALGYVSVTLAIPVGSALRRRPEPYPLGADLMLSVPLLLDSGGNALGLYERAHIDDAVHFSNGAILMTAFGAAISPRIGSRWEAATITLGIGATGAMAWEIMEFVGLKMGFRGMNLTYEDTMLDTIESFLGAVVGAGITAARWRPATAQNGS